MLSVSDERSAAFSIPSLHGGMVMCSADDPPPPWTVPVGGAGDVDAFTFDDKLRATFDFGGRIGQESYPSVSLTQEKQFREDFEEQLKGIRRVLSEYQDKGGNAWLSDGAPLPPRVTSGPYLPPADFHVVVSEVYTKSSSLLPAWLGRRGWMEFPAHRVAAREASIAHEIAHLLFPNGNRMLDEGLATYLQYKLFPKIPVWPNFGGALELLVLELLQTGYQDLKGQVRALWNMDLDGFERISTPDILSLRIGKDPPIGASSEQEKAVYGVAGAIVAFLLDGPLWDTHLNKQHNFGSLYKATPLRPFERDSGNPARWQDYYRVNDVPYSFNDLGLLWKTYMHFLLFTKSGAPLPELKAPPFRLDKRQMQLVVEYYDKLNLSF